jgi:hypothetical protein
MAPDTCRATGYPSSAADRGKEHRCHPSLRIWKLVCDDRNRNRKRCCPAHQSYSQTAPVKDLDETTDHLAFALIGASFAMKSTLSFSGGSRKARF